VSRPSVNPYDGHHSHCDCPELDQLLNWDELNAEQRIVIISAVVPPCFPFDAKRNLSEKSWASIHARTQTALRRVDWTALISGGVQ
jgi:hypothetical protein